MASQPPHDGLPRGCLEEVFARAPPVVQCLSVAQLSKGWLAWSKARPDDVRTQCRESHKPLWFLQDAVGWLTRDQKLKAARCPAAAATWTPSSS